MSSAASKGSLDRQGKVSNISESAVAIGGSFQVCLKAF